MHRFPLLYGHYPIINLSGLTKIYLLECVKDLVNPQSEGSKLYYAAI